MVRTIIQMGLFFSLVILRPVYADSDSELLARLCVGVAVSLEAFGDSAFVVAKDGAVPVQEAHTGWRGNWFGHSVPIPSMNEGWSQSISTIGSHLSRRDLEISMGPALFEAHPDTAVGKTAQELNLPQPSMNYFELLKLGLTLTPEEVECDQKNIQKTINYLTALLFKATALSEGDKAYFLSNDSVLIHTNYGHGERWSYYFRSGKSEVTKEIKFQHWLPGRYVNVGFSIAPSEDYTYSNGEPTWLVEFFKAAEQQFPSTVDEYRAAIEKITNAK